MICRKCKTKMKMLEELFNCSKKRLHGITIRKYWCPLCQEDRTIKGGELNWKEQKKDEMLTDEKIEELIKSNPEILKDFKQNQEDFLLSIRLRFQILISAGDLVGRYLLSKFLTEIIAIQEEVTKNHIKHVFRMKTLNIIDNESKTKHLRTFLKQGIVRG